MTAQLLVGLTRLVSGAQIRWAGVRPEARQRIYFANHTSHLDAMVIWAALPDEIRARTRPVAARDYWDRGKLRRWIAKEVLHVILVDRGTASGQKAPATVAAARHTVERVAAGLGAGDSLILFPEGTRGPGPDVGSFKSGLYHLVVLRPDVEIVPVYIDNLNRILPKGALLPVPLLSSVTFGPVLHLAPAETKDAFLARARAALLALRDR